MKGVLSAIAPKRSNVPIRLSRKFMISSSSRRLYPIGGGTTSTWCGNFALTSCRHFSRSRRLTASLLLDVEQPYVLVLFSLSSVPLEPRRRVCGAAERGAVCTLNRSLLEDRFRQHRVDALGDVDDLGHVQVHGGAEQHVSIVARQALGLHHEVEHLARGHLGRDVEVLM